MRPLMTLFSFLCFTALAYASLQHKPEVKTYSKQEREAFARVIENAMAESEAEDWLTELSRDYYKQKGMAK